MSKSIVAFLAFIILVIVVFVGASLISNLGTNNVTHGSSSATSSTDAMTSTAIPMTEVQKHNNASSCWTTINDGVYDLTNFIQAHPGGAQAILGLCGIDGTTAFTNQHDGQGRPNNELAGLKIGNLAK